MTYGYTGAQMVHQARRMIQEGMLGEIRIINMQFAHGYHSSAVEANDPGTKWRVTPEKAGPSYVLGDVVHMRCSSLKPWYPTSKLKS